MRCEDSKRIGGVDGGIKRSLRNKQASKRWMKESMREDG